MSSVQSWLLKTFHVRVIGTPLKTQRDNTGRASAPDSKVSGLVTTMDLAFILLFDPAVANSVSPRRRLEPGEPLTPARVLTPMPVLPGRRPRPRPDESAAPGARVRAA